jgi:hypothetical protein
VPRGYTGVTDKQTDKAVKRGQRGRFEKGTKPGPGRPKGLLNKFTGDLKEAFLQPLRRPGAAMASRVTSTTKPSGTTRRHS